VVTGSVQFNRLFPYKIVDCSDNFFFLSVIQDIEKNNKVGCAKKISYHNYLSIHVSCDEAVKSGADFVSADRPPSAAAAAMFSLFRRKSESRPPGHDDDPELDRSRLNFDASPRNLGNYRYSHYSSINSGQDSPPRIVVYSRPPENLTSPNREASPDPHQELVQDSLPPTLHQFNNHNHVRRKYSKQARNSDENKVIVVRRTKSQSGPLSFLRKSFRRHSGKQQVVTCYKLAPTSPTVSNGADVPQRNGSRERVSRKFSDPYYASATAAASAAAAAGSKLIPGRACSPKSLITLKPVAAAKAAEAEEMMYSMVVPETYINPMYSHNNNDDDVQMSRRIDDDALSKRRSIAVAPSYLPAGAVHHGFALPQIGEQVSNGFPAAAMALPRPPSNLGVPYFPPPPQTISATVDPQLPVRKNSKRESSGPKIFPGPNIRPLRISLRSKVRPIFLRIIYTSDFRGRFLFKPMQFREYFFSF
jgi:hypothetical protein